LSSSPDRLSRSKAAAGFGKFILLRRSIAKGTDPNAVCARERGLSPLRIATCRSKNDLHVFKESFFSAMPQNKSFLKLKQNLSTACLPKEKNCSSFRLKTRKALDLFKRETISHLMD